MPIPDHFCWTRFGTEAAQSIEQIIARKEEERRANNGMFFWGIGNAVGPSMRELLQRETCPQVLFSPIKSAPRAQDVAPPAVVAWTSGQTLSGESFRVPDHSLITSRFDPESPRVAHYALVCFSKEPLRLAPSVDKIVYSGLCNILTGRPVGASQVTSVVQRVKSSAGKARVYEVSLRATLIEPFFVRLDDPTPLAISAGGSKLRNDRSASVRSNWESHFAKSKPQLALAGL